MKHESAMASGAILSLSLLAGALSAAGADPGRPATRPAAASPADVTRAVDDLRSGDWIIQYRAISQLARWRSRSAATNLRAVLAGKDIPWVRGRALVALGQILGADMLTEVLPLTRSKLVELRAAAIETLGLIGSPNGDAAAAAALNDPAVEVRCQAVLAIARLRKARAWPLVKGLVGDADSRLVRHLAEALASIATDEAHGALVTLLGHGDERVRLQAIDSLAGYRRVEDIDRLLGRGSGDDSEIVRDRAFAALATYPEPAVRARALAVLHSEASDDYAAAVRLLAARATPPACDALAAVARGGDKRYRRVVADVLKCLAGHGADRYADVFVRHLDHSSSSVRREAIRGVAKGRKGDPWTTLKALLSDPSESVRRYVIDAIQAETTGSPPGGMIRYLSGPLHGSSWDTRKRAVLLVADRVTAEELAADFSEMEATLGGENSYVRELTAKLLSRTADETLRGRIAAAQGYVTAWTIAGPYANDKLNAGIETAYAPERPAGPATATAPASTQPTTARAKPVKWRPGRVVAASGELALHDVFPPPTNYRVAYVAATLRAPAAREIRLEVTSDDGCVVWLNGREVHRRKTAGTDKVTADLRRGPNRLLVKVANQVEWWSVKVRLADEKGRAVRLGPAR